MPGLSPSRASICAALASASLAWASVSVGEMRISTSPCATAVPRSTGVGDDAPGDFGGHVGLVFGHQRAGRADEPRDRLLDGGDRCGRDRRALGRRMDRLTCRWRCCSRTRRRRRRA